MNQYREVVLKFSTEVENEEECELHFQSWLHYIDHYPGFKNPNIEIILDVQGFKEPDRSN